MKQLTVAEAKENFDRCLAEVRAGEEIVLTEGGLAIARLAPEPASRPAPRLLTPEQQAAHGELMALLRRGLDLGIEKFDRNSLYDRD